MPKSAAGNGDMKKKNRSKKQKNKLRQQHEKSTQEHHTKEKPKPSKKTTEEYQEATPKPQHSRGCECMQCMQRLFEIFNLDYISNLEVELVELPARIANAEEALELETTNLINSIPKYLKITKQIHCLVPAEEKHLAEALTEQLSQMWHHQKKIDKLKDEHYKTMAYYEDLTNPDPDSDSDDQQ